MSATQKIDLSIIFLNSPICGPWLKTNARKTPKLSNTRCPQKLYLKKNELFKWPTLVDKTSKNISLRCLFDYFRSLCILRKNVVSVSTFSPMIYHFELGNSLKNYSLKMFLRVGRIQFWQHRRYVFTQVEKSISEFFPSKFFWTRTMHIWQQEIFQKTGNIYKSLWKTKWKLFFLLFGINFFSVFWFLRN